MQMIISFNSLVIFMTAEPSIFVIAHLRVSQIDRRKLNLIASQTAQQDDGSPNTEKMVIDPETGPIALQSDHMRRRSVIVPK